MLPRAKRVETDSARLHPGELIFRLLHARRHVDHRYPGAIIIIAVNQAVRLTFSLTQELRACLMR